MRTFVKFCSYMAMSIGLLITSCIIYLILDSILGDWAPLLGLTVLSVICYLAASETEPNKEKGDQ